MSRYGHADDVDNTLFARHAMSRYTSMRIYDNAMRRRYYIWRELRREQDAAMRARYMMVASDAIMLMLTRYARHAAPLSPMLMPLRRAVVTLTFTALCLLRYMLPLRAHAILLPP